MTDNSSLPSAEIIPLVIALSGPAVLFRFASFWTDVVPCVSEMLVVVRTCCFVDWCQISSRIQYSVGGVVTKQSTLDAAEDEKNVNALNLCSRLL